MLDRMKCSRGTLAVVTILLVGLLVLVGSMPGVQAGAQAGATPAIAPAMGLAYEWHTFYGLATALSEFRGVAVDAAGNVYVAGYAAGTWGTPLHPHSGSNDIVVIKLNKLGAYQWHTFYGAAPTASEDGDDEAAGIAVDTAGNVYVSGYSDRTWQGPGDISPLNPHGGDAEYMFALKLNSSGAYQWHTFYQPGRAHAIALDTTASVYVTGYSAAEWGSPLHSAAASDGHLVVLKLAATGAYQWHTYHGGGVGAGDEAGYGIALGAPTAVYVTGSATYNWQGAGAAAPLNPFSGGEGYSTDIVVLKLNTSGAYQWHTFYGAGESDDVASSLAWGGGGLYVTGHSFGAWGSPLHAHTGERDIAVLKLNSSGQRQWNTFYGSGANDLVGGIVVDADGNAYVAGSSAASWLGDGNAAPAHAHSGTGAADVVVLKLDSGGTYRRHTFYGAADLDDYGLGITLDSNHGVFATGTSQATWLGDSGISPLHAHSGNPDGDGFVLKLSDELHTVFLPVVLDRP